MKRRSPLEFVVGLVLKVVLGRVAREPAAIAPASSVPARGEPEPEREPAAAPRTDSPPGRSPLTVVMLGCLALGLPLMLIFENTFTRIAGVLLCFGFIVSGVFLIANPSYLGREVD
jgi:hypothetical protein